MWLKEKAQQKVAPVPRLEMLFSGECKHISRGSNLQTIKHSIEQDFSGIIQQITNKQTT